MRFPDHYIYGLPASSRFFLSEDTGGNATGGVGSDTLADFTPSDDNPVAKPEETPQERVEGEQLPNFRLLGKKPAPATPAETAEGEKTPAKEEKPASGAAAKPAAPVKPAAKPAESAKKPETKPAAPKPAEKPAAKPAEAPKEAVAAKEGEKKPEIPSDAEIDALQPKPGVSTQVVKDFGAMREKMKGLAGTARTAQQEAEQLRAEIATLKESTGKLPKEVEEELEGLRKFNLLFQAEQDPHFKKEFDTKVEAAETGIFKLLEKHGLQPKIIDEIKAAQKAAGGDLEGWKRWGDLVNALANPIDRQEVLDAIKARRDVVGQRSARLSEIGQSKEKFMEAIGKHQQGEQMTFAKGVEEASIPLAAANDWILEQEIPAGADDAQKQAIETRNADVKKRAEAFSDNVRAAFSRDPAKTAEIALRAVEADVLRQQNETLTTEAKKSAARVKELETQLAKIKNAGRIAHSESAPQDRASKSSTDTVQIGGDGSSALRNFFEKR